jgi:hypothetical protein
LDKIKKNPQNEKIMKQIPPPSHRPTRAHVFYEQPHFDGYGPLLGPATKIDEADGHDRSRFRRRRYDYEHFNNL